MFINSKTFYGIDSKEIQHLKKNMLPILKEDKLISQNLLGMISYMMEGEYYTEADLPPIDMPKYIFTKTTKEICNKIKITGKTISMIEAKSFDDENVKLCDHWAHISLGRSFYRYCITDKNIWVANFYLSYNEEQKKDYVSYNCWHIGLGGNADQYRFEECHKEFFQILIFLKYTEPDIKYIPSGKKVGTKKNGFYNLCTTDVQVVDSNWNTTVVRTEGFSVDGHLRLQPYGEGRSKYKLIWIDSFDKEGYVRKAKSVS